jgi:predicted Rossmann-fold nucleotide-binding protein
MGIVANEIQDGTVNCEIFFLYFIGGGKVTGIIPTSLSAKEQAGKLIGNTVVVKNMHERKLLMYQKADAFIG